MELSLTREHVMPGLVPGIHVLGFHQARKTWMAGTSPAMTKNESLLLASEQYGEPLFAGAGEVDDAAARRRIPRRPVEFGEPVHHGGTQRAGEVMTAFAPVETGLADRSSRMRQRLRVDLQRLGHEALAFAGEFDVLFCLPDQPLLAQAVEHLHAEIAGEVIVADPRPPQRRLFWSCTHAGVAGTLGQARKPFEHMGDVGAGEAIVAVTPLFFRLDQAACFEFRQV